MMTQKEMRDFRCPQCGGPCYYSLHPKYESEYACADPNCAWYWGTQEPGNLGRNQVRPSVQELLDKPIDLQPLVGRQITVKVPPRDSER